MAQLRDGIYGLAVADALGFPTNSRKEGLLPVRTWWVLGPGTKRQEHGRMTPA